ncbi:MAG: hypothetical protein A3B25_02525 [Candidatus Ryanbacteria bacterium RIFCSPLOWO2_01_FULL_48_26]|uniref:Uncharacterized protein n=1 Tax=Candidatus Ryanbacteria bacterium RIFCSPLOWO2_01_FULL_48_26 TaxID=1802126 RepID=A0A1G2GVM9_9BACT|nr:MAG: hypothetical protein A3B25_02525 [Candidatus Ryanbacteria bacterium RIFCSPLOWO2_01_FULL_48_26]
MEKQVAHEVLLDELEKATHPHAPSGRLRFLAYIIAGVKFPEETAEKVRSVLNNLMQSSTSDIKREIIAGVEARGYKIQITAFPSQEEIAEFQKTIEKLFG